MTDYLLLFVGTVLVNNFVLRSSLPVSVYGRVQKLETAMGMGLATTFVMTMASICALLIDTGSSSWAGFSLYLLRTLAFILGHCRSGAIYRNGGANQSGALSSAGYLFRC